MQLADARVSERPLFSERDRWFESAFLLRRVVCEPEDDIDIPVRFPAPLPPGPARLEKRPRFPKAPTNFGPTPSAGRRFPRVGRRLEAPRPASGSRGLLLAKAAW
jgi:hypothetical protein